MEQTLKPENKYYKKCSICKTKFLGTPKKKGGLFVADNLTTSCEECNSGKRDVLLHKREISHLIQRECKIELFETEVGVTKLTGKQENSNDIK